MVKGTEREEESTLKTTIIITELFLPVCFTGDVASPMTMMTMKTGLIKKHCTLVCSITLELQLQSKLTLQLL